ncbi:hypothetical protein CPB83DRAFT_892407 [Crepidotus variabilis]|uniref:Uncharacterized protein n=1 Tax=Crepidotus variabilis TaxID=179855 RepID=A0A9P6ELG8_9AGAR|nr:hypothetical protein CPB83DRAFT_892407 [Crepidotus variabilis]
MASVHDIPPEIIAASFEMAIFTWGISVLRPLSLVCPSWRDIIDHTPRLWGILLLQGKLRASKVKRLTDQLEKAKESPLSIVCGPAARDHPILKRIAALSHNWVMADVNTSHLSTTQWSTLKNSLQELKLSRFGVDNWNALSMAFFDDDDDGVRVLQPGKLQSFTAVALPRCWVTGFLSRNPTIRNFRLERGHNIQNTLHYIKFLYNASSIELVDLVHTSTTADPPPTTHLRDLRNLRLNGVDYPSLVLSNVAAPNLQTLTIDGKEPQCLRGRFYGVDIDRDQQPLAPFLAQWSQPGFLPEHLHTLELKYCLDIADVPYLIRWLERLNHLVRMTIVDDTVGEAATSRIQESVGETNIYRALARPRVQEDGTLCWLCPSLMILYLDTDAELSDLIPIARVRGGNWIPKDPGVDDETTLPPARLRRIESTICSGNPPERKELESLIDEMYCTCTHCGLMIDFDAAETEST